MKKYILGFITIVLFITLCGCTKKNDSIIGKWQLKEIQGGPITVVFNKDKTLEFSNANLEAKGTYKIEGNVVTFINIWDVEVQYEYEIKDDKLSLNGVNRRTLSYIDLERVK